MTDRSTASGESASQTDGELTAVILCGGRGLRAWPLTEEVPKPLITVAGVPVVDHVLGVYGRRGVRRFVLATGYLGDRIAEHVAAGHLPWEVECVDTGLDTPTAERIRRCLPVLNDIFFATYADGLADIDLTALLQTHRDTGVAATVTAVPLPSQYGTLDIDGRGRVTGFLEKPRLDDHWINAGFFLFGADVFRHHKGGDLEREVLPELAASGQLGVYRHRGFWRSLDTYKDRQELETLATAAELPPWQ